MYYTFIYLFIFVRWQSEVDFQKMRCRRSIIYQRLIFSNCSRKPRVFCWLQQQRYSVVIDQSFQSTWVVNYNIKTDFQRRLILVSNLFLIADFSFRITCSLVSPRIIKGSKLRLDCNRACCSLNFLLVWS